MPKMFPVCFSEHFNGIALACFYLASRVDLEVQVGNSPWLAVWKRCAQGPSGTMDSCVDLLKINPLNFSRIMIVFNVPPYVSDISLWPAIYIHFF